jgi:hypothetical protein
LTPHKTWLSTATARVFPGTPTPRAPADQTKPPGGPFSIRPASLKPLFGTVFACLPKHSAAIGTQLPDLCALSGDPNPIE